MKVQNIVTKFLRLALILSLVFQYSSCSNKEVALTTEEKAFAEQWNQWVEDHPKEMDDLRTRAIADSMSEEEISREMIGLMVRFSREKDLKIPQSFIDELKSEEGSQKGSSGNLVHENWS